MREQENREPVSLPGKPSAPVTEKEKTEVGDKKEEPGSSGKQEKKGETGSIPLDHDETIGIP